MFFCSIPKQFLKKGQIIFFCSLFELHHCPLNLWCSKIKGKENDPIISICSIKHKFFPK